MKPPLLAALLASLAACTHPAAGSEALTPGAPTATVPASADTAPADTSGWRPFFEATSIGNDSNDPAYCGQAMVVQFDSAQTLCIETDQNDVRANARVRWRLDAAAGRAGLLLVEPGGLGAGSARLPWSGMDTDAPLATLTPKAVKARPAEFVWHGFHTRGGTLLAGDHGAWRAGSYAAWD